MGRQRYIMIGCMIIWVLILPFSAYGETDLNLKDPFISPLKEVWERIQREEQEKKALYKPVKVETIGDSELKEVSYHKEGSEAKQVTAPEDFHLKGIIWQGQEGLVILEEGIYRVGDKYKDCTISAIKNRKVTLICGGQKHEYSMSEKH